MADLTTCDIAKLLRRAEGYGDALRDREQVIVLQELAKVREAWERQWSELEAVRGMFSRVYGAEKSRRESLSGQAQELVIELERLRRAGALKSAPGSPVSRGDAERQQGTADSGETP